MDPVSIGIIYGISGIFTSSLIGYSFYKIYDKYMNLPNLRMGDELYEVIDFHCDKKFKEMMPDCSVANEKNKNIRNKINEQLNNYINDIRIKSYDDIGSIINIMHQNEKDDKILVFRRNIEFSDFKKKEFEFKIDSLIDLLKPIKGDIILSVISGLENLKKIGYKKLDEKSSKTDYYFNLIGKDKITGKYLLILFKYNMNSKMFEINIPFLKISKLNTNYCHVFYIFTCIIKDDLYSTNKQIKND